MYSNLYNPGNNFFLYLKIEMEISKTRPKAEIPLPSEAYITL